MIPLPLIEAIRRQYQLSWTGIHGPSHWARVLENGLRLAKTTGANPEVVKLFAVFHDACRKSEDWDPRHGSRGADLADAFRGKFFELDDQEFVALKVACRLHTDGLTDGDVTVQTCWDSDRLDLGRVGIKPQSRYLCTAAARDPAMILWADDRACSGMTPEIANDWLSRQPSAV